jgi:hypothetical protein
MDENIVIGLLVVAIIILAAYIIRNYMGYNYVAPVASKKPTPIMVPSSAPTVVEQPTAHIIPVVVEQPVVPKAMIGLKYQTTDADVIDFMNICQPAITSLVNKNKHILINELTKLILLLKVMDDNTWHTEIDKMRPIHPCKIEHDIVSSPGYNQRSPAIKQLITDIAKYISTNYCANGKVDKNKVIQLLEKLQASIQ